MRHDTQLQKLETQESILNNYMGYNLVTKESIFKLQKYKH